MARTSFWQDANRRFRLVGLVCLALLPALPWLSVHAVRAAETVRVTPRQAEIIEDLETYKPEWDENPGVWMLGRWDSDSGFEQLVSLPAAPGNAAERFRLLEDLFPSEKELLEAGGEQTRGVDALIEAAGMAECRFIPDYYPPYESTEARQPEFVVIRMYFQALLQRADAAARAGNTEEADRCYQAALACGRHLTNDKSSSLIYVTGLIFKQQAAQAYVRYLQNVGNPAKSALASTYLRRIVEVMRAWTWKMNTALGEMDGFACLPAVLLVATEDQEVFWRKAAVEKLGMLRYGIPDFATNSVKRDPYYEAMADNALRDVARNDPDASVRKLAIWVAMNLNLSGYKEMRQIFLVD